MGLFFRSYDKPGPGIDPDAPQKRSFFRFFDIFFRKFWHFSKTSMLYSVTLIPTFIIIAFLMMIVTLKMAEGVATEITSQESAWIILPALFLANLYTALWGMGPATAGVTYIMRNFSREEHAWLWSDFKDSVKGNFKQAIVVFLIDLVMAVLFYVAIVVYSSMTGFMSAFVGIVYLMIAIYTMMHFYIYPMMVTFDLKLKDLYRNALLFTISKLPSNLFVAAVLVLLHLVLPIYLIFVGGQYTMILLLVFLMLEIVILQGFSAFLVNFNAYPKLKKYMIDPITEQNGTEEKEEQLFNEPIKTDEE